MYFLFTKETVLLLCPELIFRMDRSGGRSNNVFAMYLYKPSRQLEELLLKNKRQHPVASLIFMSISPIDTQDSTSSSSSAPPQSSSSHHGLVQPSELLRSPTSDSDQIQTLGSLSIASSAQSSLGLSTATSGEFLAPYLFVGIIWSSIPL